MSGVHTSKRRRVARVIFSLGGVLLLATAALYLWLAWSEGAPAAEREYFRMDRDKVLVIAHRGGAGLWPENTMRAFEEAHAAGVDVIETDVRATSDGALVLVHDATVERTTDGRGRVGAMTLAELKRLDAGYRWTRDGGHTFPFRGQGLTVPTLEEALARFPGARFNIEPKQEAPSIVEPLCRLLRERAAVGRVVVASFHSSVVSEFRRACPEVATAASSSEATDFLARYRAGVSESYSPPMQALQVPEHGMGMTVLTRGFVEAAHRRNLLVHAWTVNDEAGMRRLVGAGVDGIMTDYPDRLLEVLGRRRP